CAPGSWPPCPASMTTRETPSPSCRESENLPLEFAIGATGGSAFAGAGVEGSGASVAAGGFDGGAAPLACGTVGLVCGSVDSVAAAFVSLIIGGGTATAGAAAGGVGTGTVATARRKSMTSRYGP